MIALLRRQPLVSYFVIAFAWTWAFVIVFLILFPLPDVIVWTTPGDLGPLIGALVVTAAVASRTGDLFPGAKNNEVAPVIAFVGLALVILLFTRGRLGYHAAQPIPASQPAYSAP